MEDVQIKESNINLFENNIQNTNNSNTTNENQNNNISSQDNLKLNNSKKSISKFQKFKISIYEYASKMAFWKKKNKKNNTQNKESKIDKQKKLEQKSLDRQINIYANEKFIKEYGFGFNCFI